MSALETKKWKDREIKKGLEYVYPKQKHNFLKLKQNELAELIKTSDKENLVKALAIDLGLGGLYAEELLLRAKIDKNKKKLIEKEISTLFDKVKELRKLKLSPTVVGKEILPVDMVSFQDKEKHGFTTFNEALDNTLTKHIITKKSETHEKEATKKISKEERILDNQGEHIIKLKKQADENQIIGEAIYHNYQLIDEILFEITKAKKNLDWKQIKEKLKGHKIVKQINEKNQEVIVEVKEK